MPKNANNAIEQAADGFEAISSALKEGSGVTGHPAELAIIIATFLEEQCDDPAAHEFISKVWFRLDEHDQKPKAVETDKYNAGKT